MSRDYMQVRNAAISRDYCAENYDTTFDPHISWDCRRYTLNKVSRRDFFGYLDSGGGPCFRLVRIQPKAHCDSSLYFNCLSI